MNSNETKEAVPCFQLRRTQFKEEEIMALNERQFCWEKLLNLEQWFCFGKDFNRTMYENSILGSGEYFENDKKSQVTKESVDKEIHKMKILNLVLPDKKLRQCDKYLFVDDILPSTTQPKLSSIAAAIDLQALDLAVKEISNIPFNEERLHEFVHSHSNDNSFNIAALDVVGGLWGVKKNMILKDWMVLRDLYVEFKVTGIIKVQKVCTSVLEMVARSNPFFRPWARAASPPSMLSALKVGTLLLNLFHFCYSDAIKVVKKSNIMHWNEVEPKLMAERHLGLLTESDPDLVNMAEGDTPSNPTKLTNTNQQSHKPGSSRSSSKQQASNNKATASKKISLVESTTSTAPRLVPRKPFSSQVKINQTKTSRKVIAKPGSKK